MRGFRSALFRALLFIGLLFVASHFNVAAANMLNYHDTDGVAGSGTASPAFIPGISPIYDFYSYWDTANLDPYRFDFSNTVGKLLID